MTPAASYALISREVDALVAKASENDPDRAAYMVARAALLTVRGRRGEKAAAEVAFRLGDEMVSGETG